MRSVRYKIKENVITRDESKKYTRDNESRFKYYRILDVVKIGEIQCNIINIRKLQRALY